MKPLLTSDATLAVSSLTSILDIALASTYT